MSTHEDVERIKQELRRPRSSLLTVPMIVARTGLPEADVRRAIAAHWDDFRVSARPILNGEHVIGLVEDETDAQRTARLLRAIRGRLLGARRRDEIRDSTARHVLEAQEMMGFTIPSSAVASAPRRRSTRRPARQQTPTSDTQPAP